MSGLNLSWSIILLSRAVLWIVDKACTLNHLSWFLNGNALQLRLRSGTDRSWARVTGSVLRCLGLFEVKIVAGWRLVQVEHVRVVWAQRLVWKWLLLDWVVWTDCWRSCVECLRLIVRRLSDCWQELRVKWVSRPVWKPCCCRSSLLRRNHRSYCPVFNQVLRLTVTAVLIDVRSRVRRAL